jgi:hypothetical protein
MSGREDRYWLALFLQSAPPRPCPLEFIRLKMAHSA